MADKTEKKVIAPGGTGTSWYQWSSSTMDAQNKFLSKIALIEAGIIGCLAIVIMLLVILMPTPKYFSVTPDLRVAELVPVDIPYVSSAAVTNWTAKVLTETLSFDFRHWRRTVGDAQHYYSTKGFNGLVGALKSSGIISRVEERRLITSLVVNGAPVVSAQGLMNGIYNWQVEVPVILEYEGASGTTNKQDLLAVVMISRQDTRIKPEGIAVEQVTLTPRR